VIDWLGRVIGRVLGLIRLALVALTFGCWVTAIPLVTDPTTRTLGIVVAVIPPVLFALYVHYRWKKARAADE
jgi:hypothetical protein